MNVRELSSKSKSQILRRLSYKSAASETSLKALMKGRKIPKDLQWEPSWCITRGDETILVYVLASQDIPPYLEAAIEKLREGGCQNAYVLILARDLMLEATEDTPPTPLPAPYAASAVAEKAMNLGCALAFEAEKSVHLVFDGSYTAPNRCARTRMETGHIPKWLFHGLAASSDFSPKLQNLLNRFATDYERATRRDFIANDREARLLIDFAKSFANAEKRLFLPVGSLETLRQFEMSGATRARDHFFHTFNNLFLGFHVLGRLFSGQKMIPEVDKFIRDDSGRSTLNPWEVLWFLTCICHDPAYMAENFWASFRFNFGIRADASGDAEIPEEVKGKIRDLWDSEFAAPRKDLHDLYNRTVRRWVPPSVAEKGADLFDEALKKAYFDGRAASHSLISGLNLINNCRIQKVPRARKFNSKTALAACEIAALCMMFHDPRCRSSLKNSGIPPIPFESLPYACVLMYVDCLQDDRRDISISRFNKHGVLASVEISPQRRTVEAQVCLPEVLNGIKGWPGRIAEYESVMGWINAKSETKFTIDYRSRAKLPN
jgi:hypothetical protein